ncbi:MAG TPA: N-acetylmuramoyl-L-alanine amidase [Gemmatimonadaceae bacterium]|nr:N-acetylmuramoyl-L-alanine amidase [Gemmatimonadaceae bacterium]
MRLRLVVAAGLATLAFAACSRLPGAATTPTAGDGPSGLPAIPLAEGRLAPRVQYPAANSTIGTRDSNFVFGSVGNGRATLTINGLPVRVAPNGAWLAFLPVPRATGRYELVAAVGADTARLTHPVRVSPVAAAPVPLAEAGRLAVDSASVVLPRARTLLREEERVRVGIRAPANATVWVGWDGGLQMLAAQPASANLFATEVPARALRGGGTLFVARGADTVRFPIARVETVDPITPRLVQLGDPTPADTDRVVIGRPTPAGSYKWLLLPGTVVEQTGRQDAFVRVRLDSQLEVWIDSGDVQPLAAGALLARRTAGNITLAPSAEWVDVQIPMPSRAPFLVEQQPRRVVLTLYGTTQSVDLIRHLGNDTLVRVVSWVPEASDRVRLDLELSQDPYGYLVLWEPGRMVLRLRRPPAIDARRPLQGLTLVVDAGHPPGGAIGPTGLTEAQAALDVARRVQRLLEERGARVVMTRTTMDAVDLRQRSVIARRANAHALLSIHLNAFGEGVNPFTQNGTSTLFFHPQSEPLSRAIQRHLMRRLGLRDLGIHYQNIAIGRTTWMPALITEGLFLMVPEQEHAMRTEQGQEAYARGVVDGTVEYFRGLGTRD